MGCTVRITSTMHAWVQVQRHKDEKFDDAVDRLLRQAIQAKTILENALIDHHVDHG